MDRKDFLYYLKNHHDLQEIPEEIKEALQETRKHNGCLLSKECDSTSENYDRLSQ